MTEDYHLQKLEGSGNIHQVKECVMVSMASMELTDHVVEFRNFHLKVLTVLVLVLGGSHHHLRVVGFREREVCRVSLHN